MKKYWLDLVPFNATGGCDRDKVERQLAVTEPTALVDIAFQDGDETILHLRSTASPRQSSRKYDFFFEKFRVKIPEVEIIPLDGLDVAMWEYKIDEDRIGGSSKLIKKINECLRAHSLEAKRVQDAISQDQHRPGSRE